MTSSLLPAAEVVGVTVVAALTPRLCVGGAAGATECVRADVVRASLVAPLATDVESLVVGAPAGLMLAVDAVTVVAVVVGAFAGFATRRMYPTR